MAAATRLTPPSCLYDICACSWLLICIFGSVNANISFNIYVQNLLMLQRVARLMKCTGSRVLIVIRGRACYSFPRSSSDSTRLGEVRHHATTEPATRLLIIYSHINVVVAGFGSVVNVNSNTSKLVCVADLYGGFGAHEACWREGLPSFIRIPGCFWRSIKRNKVSASIHN